MCENVRFLAFISRSLLLQTPTPHAAPMRSLRRAVQSRLPQAADGWTVESPWTLSSASHSPSQGLPVCKYSTVNCCETHRLSAVRLTVCFRFRLSGVLTNHLNYLIVPIQNCTSLLGRWLQSPRGISRTGPPIHHQMLMVSSFSSSTIQP